MIYYPVFEDYFIGIFVFNQSDIDVMKTGSWKDRSYREDKIVDPDTSTTLTYIGEYGGGEYEIDDSYIFNNLSAAQHQLIRFVL